MTDFWDEPTMARIIKYNGEDVKIYGNYGTNKGNFRAPAGVTTRLKNGVFSIFVADGSNDNVQELIYTATSPTSTPTPTPTSVQSSNNSSSSSSSGWSSPVCNDSKPLRVPDLFQINTTKNTAKIFFTPIDTNQFYISFSTKPNAEENGEKVTLLKEGVQSETIYLLKPNTTYYLKVRGQNGCASGDWSNIMKFKTDSEVYYKNYPLLDNLVPNLSVKKISKIINSSTAPEIVSVPIQSPKPTESVKKLSETTNSKPAKKCFLWWCWTNKV